MRRSRGRAVLAVVFAVLGVGGWVQAFINLVSPSEPRILVAFHALLGATATAAAVGGWSVARWTPIPALLYGVATAGLLLALTPVLHLDPSEAGGLRSGAAVMLAFAVWAAWYFRRSGRTVPT